jgi:hypothetical protein
MRRRYDPVAAGALPKGLKGRFPQNDVIGPG